MAAPLLGLASLTLGVRLALAINTSVISSDTEAFLWIASDWAAGNRSAAIQNPIGYHPFYPILIATVARWLGDPITASRIVTIACATLLVFPFYALVRDLWSRRVALYSVFLYAVHPVWLDVGSEGMSEAPFYFFFLTTITGLWLAARRRNYAMASAVGFTAAAALLTRVEGIYLPVYAGVLAIAGGCIEIQRRGWLRGLREASRLGAGLALFLVVMTLVAAPYLIEIRERTGGWHFTMKGSVPGAHISVIEGAEDAASTSAPRPAPEVGAPPPPPRTKWDRWRDAYGALGGALVGFGRYFYRSANVVFLLLIFAGMAIAITSRQARGGWRWRQLYAVFWAAGLFAPILLSLLLGRSDADKRYFLGGWLLLLPFGAVLLIRGVDLGRARVRSIRWRRCAYATALVLVCLPSAVEFRKVRRGDQILARHCGDVVHRLATATGRSTPLRVASHRRKLVFYCGGAPWPPPLSRAFAPLVRQLDASDTDFFVLLERDADRIRGGWPDDGFLPGWERYEVAGYHDEPLDRILVYRRIRPADPPGSGLRGATARAP